MTDWNVLPKSTSILNTWTAFPSFSNSNSQKKSIHLTIGNPNSSGVFKIPDFIQEVLHIQLQNSQLSGYTDCIHGHLPARQAISEKALSIGSHVTENDVIITSGSSSAAELIFRAIASPESDIILLPRPCLLLLIYTNKNLYTVFIINSLKLILSTSFTHDFDPNESNLEKLIFLSTAKTPVTLFYSIYLHPPSFRLYFLEIDATFYLTDSNNHKVITIKQFFLCSAFFLYPQICTTYNIRYEYYDLIPEAEWNVDLFALEEKLKNPAVKYLLVNNPSNPTGSVYSSEHIQEILELADKYHVPIISDEIYNDLTWDGKSYVPFASITSNVPIIELNGLSKRYMVPGWRIGWIVFHSKQHDCFKEIREAVSSLLISLGPASILQSAIPYLLNETDNQYFEANKNKLKKASDTVNEGLKESFALRTFPSYGGMQGLTWVDLQKLDIDTTMEFTELLYQEQSVSVLPGEMFGLGGYIRITFVNTLENIKEGCERICNFCLNHKLSPITN